jgi:hypothetical protein
MSRWTKEMDEAMRLHYPHQPTNELVQIFGKSASAIYNRANLLGLHKSDEYLAGPNSGRLRRDSNNVTRFQKGHTPWNKGMKGWQAEGVQATQFKRGAKPQTLKPIGSERFDKDGNLVLKVADTRHKKTDWRPKHVLIWERLHGAVPKGHIVVFRNKNKADFNPSNLLLLTRSENMQRNSHYNNYPPEISRLIQLRGALNRQIRRIENEQH